MTTEAKFQAAVNIIRSLPKDGPYQPSHEMMLKFYGLYKQAVEGPCEEPKPAFYEVIKGYKWRAWKSLGNMTKAEAMDTYVEELKKIIETMSYTEDVANFIDVLGPFYEFVDLTGQKGKYNNNDDGKCSDLSGDDSDSEEIVDLPVSNGILAPGKTNGVHDSDSDLGSVSDATQSSSPECSPSHNLVTEDVKEEEEDEEMMVVEVQHESDDKTIHILSLSSRVNSDTDSDEEYSEPAETPDHLAKVESLIADESDSTSQTLQPLEGQVRDGYMVPAASVAAHHDASTFDHNASTDNHDASTDNHDASSHDHDASSHDHDASSHNHDAGMPDLRTCGGGDQSHPGGLQMTPRQSSQRFSGTPVSPSQISLASPNHMGSFAQGSSGGGGAGGSGGNGGRMNITEDVNAQLVVVLRRLQTDMESVLHRLNTLETITLSQHHNICHACQGRGRSSPSGHMETSWWPFPELSPRSTFILLVWPLILHGGIKLLLLLRSRRRR